PPKVSLDVTKHVNATNPKRKRVVTVEYKFRAPFSSFRAKSRNPVAEGSGYATGFFDSVPLRSERPRILSRMDTNHIILLFLAIGVIALLYSSVGHAGASGYIATMTLFGIAPIVIRPTALVLNILVASIGTFQFWRAGYFSWNLFWPFALLSIPGAYLGGYLQPSASVLKILIG